MNPQRDAQQERKRRADLRKAESRIDSMNKDVLEHSCRALGLGLSDKDSMIISLMNESKKDPVRFIESLDSKEVEYMGNIDKAFELNVIENKVAA